MTHVERFNAVMNFEAVDRYPRIEWAGYWDKTVNRWREEGLDASWQGAESIRENLGLDPYSQFWIASGSADTPRPTHHGSGILPLERMAGVDVAAIGMNSLSNKEINSHDG